MSRLIMKMKKILKFILFGILLYVTVIAIEICCIYAVEGENTLNYLKDVWNWYRTLF